MQDDAENMKNVSIDVSFSASLAYFFIITYLLKQTNIVQVTLSCQSRDDYFLLDIS